MCVYVIIRVSLPPLPFPVTHFSAHLPFWARVQRLLHFIVIFLSLPAKYAG